MQHTPGNWTVFICDDGGQWSGWPLSIGTDDPERTVVKPGGFYPYEWDRGVSQREAVANAHVMAASTTMLALLKELIDIEGPQPGTSVWAAKVRAAIAKATGE